MRTKLLLAFITVAAASGALAGCGEDEAPIFPTYETDVAPLLAARCIRCHGAGGTMFADPEISQAWIDGRNAKTPQAPVNGVEYHRIPKGDFSTKAGAMEYGMSLYSLGKLNEMPPPPFPQLTSREWAIFKGWDGVR
jgi:hypothetical protein